MSADEDLDCETADDDQEQACWSDMSRAVDDLAKLANTVQSILPSLPLTCQCNNATCKRCELERIVAENARPVCVQRPGPYLAGDPIPC